MASHLSSIGFNVSNTKELLALCNRAGKAGKKYKVRDGHYHYWKGHGEELWIQGDRTKELRGLSPHFVGKSSIRICLTGPVKRVSDSPLDGAMEAWANASNEPDPGDYPIVFDCPNYATHLGLTFPVLTSVQIAAFAYTLQCFESVEAYKNFPTEEKHKLADQAFIPIGTFAPGGGRLEPPESTALLTGHVLAAEQRANKLTGEYYWWALVDSYGAAYDIVADPTVVSGSLKRGAVVRGTFWLSGRLLELERHQWSVLRRLLAR